jgi:hypothetical protein
VSHWQEAVRRAIIEEAEPAASGRLISALNRAMEATRREILLLFQQQQVVEEGGSSDSDEEGDSGGELERLRGEVALLRDQLTAEREEREQEARRPTPPADVDLVEARLAEMAALLQVPVWYMYRYGTCTGACLRLCPPERGR